MSSTFVATFVAAPSRPTLSDAFLARAAQAAPAGATTGWLDRGVAADLMFETSEEIGPFRARLEQAAREAETDVIVQPLATRAKRLLVADMDSTLIGQ